jgi:branched-chain amino acid transport system permease protein
MTIAVLVGCVISAFFVGPYHDFQIAGVFCAWLGIQGVVVLTGFTGVTTLGQGGLFGLGAYSCLLLVTKAGLPYAAAVPTAAAICTLIGALLALPAARIRGPHLAIVTIAVAVLVPSLIDAFPSLTGGENGITVSGPLASPFSAIPTGLWEYFLTLILAVLGATSVLVLRSSSFGRRLATIKRSEALAAAMGTNTYADVIVAFALTGLYGGLGGALMAILNGSTSPDAFTFDLSASFLLAAIIGGTSAPFGALAGAFIVTLVPELTTTLPRQLPEYLYAGIPLLIIYGARWLETSDNASRVIAAIKARPERRSRS